MDSRMGDQMSSVESSVGSGFDSPRRPPRLSLCQVLFCASGSTVRHSLSARGSRLTVQEREEHRSVHARVGLPETLPAICSAESAFVRPNPHFFLCSL